MADNTGAPWLLPYPEDTDLVRDGASDIEALAVAAASGLTAANIGIGTNLVQTVKTDTFSTSSATYVDVTGLTVTITPSSATAKILLIAQVNIGGTGDDFQRPILRFSGGNSTTYIAGAAGSRAVSVGGIGTSDLPAFRGQIINNPMVFLDSPASASAVTYSVQMASRGGAGFVNRSAGDEDNDKTVRGASSITVIEVAP